VKFRVILYTAHPAANEERSERRELSVVGVKKFCIFGSDMIASYVLGFPTTQHRNVCITEQHKIKINLATCIEPVVVADSHNVSMLNCERKGECRKKSAHCKSPS
jgi:hypothetical protein